MHVRSEKCVFVVAGADVASSEMGVQRAFTAGSLTISPTLTSVASARLATTKIGTEGDGLLFGTDVP